MDRLIEQIRNPDLWPMISNPDNLESLNDIADSAYLNATFEGKFGALLIYHQICEAMCIHLLENCEFFIKLAIHPMTMARTIKPNRMLGFYIDELKSSIDFEQKDLFISKVTSFKEMRNRCVHGLTKNNKDQIEKDLDEAKNKFDCIFQLYDDIQDRFRLDFHGFEKDVFIDYDEDGD